MDDARKALFVDKYRHAGHIWSGHTFMDCQHLKDYLTELPISEVAAPRRPYTHRDQGNLDYVYGELLYNLSGFEGYFHDKAYHLDEVEIRPVLGGNTFSLEFVIHYTSKNGHKGVKTLEVLRTGEREYLLFADKYRLS
ncbi:MAG: hypothetical protein K6T55_12295 [Syntrophobacterales bacterium]|nr:hypothetical protein [Syntrophobacterales bacterium]